MRKKDGREKGVRRTKIFIHTTHLHPTNEQTKKLKDFCSGRHVYEEKWKHEKESRTFSYSSSSFKLESKGFLLLLYFRLFSSFTPTIFALPSFLNDISHV